jgi:hypothetical protein
MIKTITAVYESAELAERVVQALVEGDAIGRHFIDVQPIDASRPDDKTRVTVRRLMGIEVKTATRIMKNLAPLEFDDKVK